MKLFSYARSKWPNDVRRAKRALVASSQTARNGENLHYILLLRKEQLLRKRNFKLKHDSRQNGAARNIRRSAAFPQSIDGELKSRILGFTGSRDFLPQSNSFRLQP